LSRCPSKGLPNPKGRLPWLLAGHEHYNFRKEEEIEESFS